MKMVESEGHRNHKISHQFRGLFVDLRFFWKQKAGIQMPQAFFLLCLWSHKGITHESQDSGCLFRGRNCWRASPFSLVPFSDPITKIFFLRCPSSTRVLFFIPGPLELRINSSSFPSHCSLFSAVTCALSLLGVHHISALKRRAQNGNGPPTAYYPAEMSPIYSPGGEKAPLYTVKHLVSISPVPCSLLGRTYQAIMEQSS